jgi:hypothetical protein
MHTQTMSFGMMGSTCQSATAVILMCIPWLEFYAIVEGGINFFYILDQLVSEFMQSCNPPTIKARLQNEPRNELHDLL